MVLVDVLLQLKDNATEKLKKFQKSAQDTSSTLVQMGKGLVAATAIKEIAQSTYQASALFEKLQVSLRTVTGSTTEAAQAFDFLQKLSGKIGSSVEDTTQAFIKMKSLGLSPTESAITSFANTSAAMGKDLNQMIEAVADAATGEFERLKEFGIKSKQQGDKVQFTFQGVTTTVGKNSAEIVKYLEGIGNVQFGGAAAAQMNTLDGASKRLSSSWTTFWASFGDTGVKQSMTSVIGWVADLFDFLTRNMYKINMVMTAVIAGMIDRWIDFKFAGLMIFGIIDLTFKKMIEGVANAWNAFVAGIQIQANAFAKAVGIKPFFEQVRQIKFETESYSDAIARLNKEKAAEIEANHAVRDAMMAEIEAKGTATKTADEYAEKLKKEAEAKNKNAAASAEHAAYIARYGEVYKSITKELYDYETTTVGVGYAEKQLNQDLKSGKINADQYTRAMKQLAGVKDELAKKTTGYNATLEDMKRGLENDTKAINEAIAALAELDKMFLAGQISADVWASENERLTQVVETNNGRIKTSTEKTTTVVSEFWAEAGRNMQDILSTYFFDWIEGKQQSLVQSFKRMIDQMVAQWLAAKALQALFGGEFTQTGSVGGILGGLIGGARAEGGPVSAGVPYLVGERGPELVVPKFDATVIPNSELAGGNRVVNFSIQAMDAQDTARFFERNKRQLAQLVNGANTTFNLRTV